VGTGVREELLALLVEDVVLKAEEMHIAFAIADGGPGVGLVRKPTKESDWRDVPPIDSVRLFERQLARRREQTGRGSLGRTGTSSRATPTGRSQSDRTR
jgi:hypothetical protein